MEPLVSVAGSHGIVGGNGRIHLCQSSGRARTIVSGEILSGLPHSDGLEVQAREVGVLQISQGALAHAGTLAWLHLDEIEGSQPPDGLAHRHHAHAQLLGQFLQAQWRARGDTAIDDGVEELSGRDIRGAINLGLREHG